MFCTRIRTRNTGMLVTLAVLALYNFVLLSVLATVYGGMKARPEVLLQLYQNKGWTKYGFLVIYFTLHGLATITSTIGDGAKVADKLLTQGIIFAASTVSSTLNKPRYKAQAQAQAQTAATTRASPLACLLSMVSSVTKQTPPLNSNVCSGNRGSGLDVGVGVEGGGGLAVAPPVSRTRKRIAGLSSTPPTSPNPCLTPPRPAAATREPGSSGSDGRRSPPGSPQTPTAATNSSPSAS